jgi:hypothetical protein
VRVPLTLPDTHVQIRSKSHSARLRSNLKERFASGPFYETSGTGLPFPEINH